MRARIAAGVVLLVAGAAWLADSAGLVDVPLRALLPAVLIVVGLAMLGSPRRSHHWLIVLGVALTMILAIGTAVLPQWASGTAGFGERNIRPTLPPDDAVYELDAGELTIDLTGVRIPAGEQASFRARVAFGQLVVRIPKGVGIRGRARVAAGEIEAFGRTDSGIAASMQLRRSAVGSGTLVVELQVGFGQIMVDERAASLDESRQLPRRTPRIVDPSPTPARPQRATPGTAPSPGLGTAPATSGNEGSGT